MSQNSRRMVEALERIADALEKLDFNALRDPGTVEPRWEVQGRDLVEPPLGARINEWLERAEAARTVLDAWTPLVIDTDPHLDSPPPEDFFAHNVEIPR